MRYSHNLQAIQNSSSTGLIASKEEADVLEGVIVTTITFTKKMVQSQSIQNAASIGLIPPQEQADILD